jgi:hypothetical protein
MRVEHCLVPAHAVVKRFRSDSSRPSLGGRHRLKQRNQLRCDAVGGRRWSSMEPPSVRHPSSATCATRVTRAALHVSSHVAYHASHVTRHASSVTHHASHAKYAPAKSEFKVVRLDCMLQLSFTVEVKWEQCMRHASRVTCYASDSPKKLLSVTVQSAQKHTVGW